MSRFFSRECSCSRNSSISSSFWALIGWFFQRRVSSVAPEWHSWLQSSLPNVLLRGVWAGKDCIGLCQSFQIVSLCLHYLHNNLDVLYRLMMLFWRGRYCTIDVLHRSGVPPCSCGCYRSFLLSVRSVKKNCILPTSWGRLIVVSTLRCRRWKPSFAPKGWSLWKSSWRQRLSGLLIARILSPFTNVQLVRQGVPRGRMAPSSWLRSPRGQFCQSPCIWKKMFQHGECGHMSEPC